MANERCILESYSGVTPQRKKSRNPARWDRWQSITGLILALFIIFHMMFTSSILFGEEAFNWVVKQAEADFLFEGGLPIITKLVTLFIFIAFIAHAFLAMRKFPANYRQYITFITHRSLMKHCDTTLWWVQFLTGFLLFFMGSAHLVTILFNVETIGATSAAYRFVHGGLEYFYLVLLAVMVLHAGIGLYRLVMKWIPLEAENKKAMDARIKGVKVKIFALFGTLALIALCADFVYISLGKTLTKEQVHSYIEKTMER
ncbi:MAG: fumarate reductase cytochrome b subunit [Wolinella sp.]